MSYSEFPGPIVVNFKKCAIVRAQTHDRINIFRAIAECLGKDKDEVIHDFYALNEVGYGCRSTRNWVVAFQFHIMGSDKKKIVVNDHVCKCFDYICVLYWWLLLIVKDFCSVYDVAIVCGEKANRGKDLNIIKVLADSKKLKVFLYI